MANHHHINESTSENNRAKLNTIRYLSKIEPYKDRVKKGYRKRLGKSEIRKTRGQKSSSGPTTARNKNFNPHLDVNKPPVLQESDNIAMENKNTPVRRRKYSKRKVARNNRRNGFPGLSNMPVTGPFSMFADQLPMDWIQDLSVDAIVSLNQSYGAREALRPFNVTEEHLRATNMSLRRWWGGPVVKQIPKEPTYEKNQQTIRNVLPMACVTLVQTYYAAMVDIRSYVGKRLTYQRNLAYEVGYITHSVIYYYQCLLEFFHQAYKRFYMKQDKSRTPVAYMIYIYVHMVHLSKVISHLCNMMHELPKRYRWGGENSVFEDYHLYGKSEIKDSHLLSPEALKRIAQMNKDKHMKERNAFMERRKQIRKQKQEQQDQMVKNFDWSKVGPQTRKPNKPHYWEVEYGWSIEDNWSNGIPFEHLAWSG